MSPDIPARPLALVRPPSATPADGLVTHLDRQPVDVESARRQWADYRAALTGAGWSTATVPALDSAPDAVFVEDAVVVLGETAVITRPGAPSRRAETAAIPPVAHRLGLRVVELAAGRLDGGDVLKIGSKIYAGLGGRTDRRGVSALAAIAEPLGYRVIPVPVTRVLHLKSAVTALPDGTVIGYPPRVDDPGVFDAFLPVPEPAGSAVVVLDQDTVLLSAAAPQTAAMLRGRGLAVVATDISEFERLEGCVTCLSVRIR